MKKSILLALGLAVTVLTACVLPEKEDPFERLPEENLETIEGKLFPFSVSVSTRATHRLEQDGICRARIPTIVFLSLKGFGRYHLTVCRRR